MKPAPEDPRRVATMDAWILPVLLAALPGAAAGEPSEGPRFAREGLRFAPAPGLALEKTLEVGHELALERMGAYRTGGQLVGENFTGWVTTSFKVVAQDRYQECGDGRPLRFERTYTDVGGSGKVSLQRGPQRRQTEEHALAASPLRDRKVEFTWIGPEEDWARAWSRDDAEEAWLAGLRGDMDLLALLPPGEVQSGTTWEPPIEAARALLTPGGNHLITPSTSNVFGRSIEVGVGGDFSDVLGPELSGRLLARYAGERAQDGRRLGVIEIEIQGLRSLCERDEIWRTSMPPEEKKESSRLLSVLLAYTLDAKGELLWDLEAGHFRSLELGGQETFALSVAKEVTDGKSTFERTALSEYSGKMTLKLSCASLAGER